MAGRCSDEAWFRFHDASEHEVAARDFLEFVVRHGVERGRTARP